jgi:hypothetical protein
MLVSVSVAVEIANCLPLSSADLISFSKPQLDALAIGFLRLRASGLVREGDE